MTQDQARLDPKAGEFIGSISYVNVFDVALDSSVITWMSHGCGESLVNAILPWSQFISGFVGDVDIQRPALCTDSEGEYICQCLLGEYLVAILDKRNQERLIYTVTTCTVTGLIQTKLANQKAERKQ